MGYEVTFVKCEVATDKNIVKMWYRKSQLIWICE